MEHCFGGVGGFLASYILACSSHNPGGVTRAGYKWFYLSRSRTRIRRLSELYRTLDLLVEHGVLHQTDGGRYTLLPERPDFFVLLMEKRVRVSREYHRSMKFHVKAIALRNGIGELGTGTVVWANWTYQPLTVLHEPKRVNPLGSGGDVEWRRTKREGVGVDLNLVFYPPLHVGEIIEYGFYTWTRNYYARSREEAFARFGDERVREGLGLRQNVDVARLSVTPHVGYSDARVDFDCDPFQNKPNTSRVLFRFEEGLDTLRWSVHKPEPGRYFVSWIPPNLPPH